MQGKYSMQDIFLRVWLSLFSDSSNPLLRFLRSYCSMSLLSSPQSSCIFPCSLQLLLFIFSPLPPWVIEDRCFPFSLCFLVVLIVDTKWRRFWLWAVLFCVTNHNILGLLLALAGKLLGIIHLFSGWIFPLGSSHLPSCSMKRKETSQTINSSLSQRRKKRGT